MILKELETQLLALNHEEKTQAIQLLAQSLKDNWKGISKTPGVCGGDACITGTRITVWLLVKLSSLIKVQMMPKYSRVIILHLTAADLVNVWAYAQAYPEEIEKAIREE